MSLIRAKAILLGSGATQIFGVSRGRNTGTKERLKVNNDPAPRSTPHRLPGSYGRRKIFPTCVEKRTIANLWHSPFEKGIVCPAAVLLKKAPSRFRGRGCQRLRRRRSQYQITRYDAPSPHLIGPQFRVVAEKFLTHGATRVKLAADLRAGTRILENGRIAILSGSGKTVCGGHLLY